MKNTYAPCAVPQSTLVNAINLNIYFLHLHEKRNIHNVLVSLLAAQYYPGGRRERERRREKYKIERERRRGKEKERGRKMGEEREKPFQRVVQIKSIIEVFLLEISMSVAYA